MLSVLSEISNSGEGIFGMNPWRLSLGFGKSQSQHGNGTVKI